MGLFGSLFKKEEQDVHPFEWYLDSNNSPKFYNKFIVEAARECCYPTWSDSKKTLELTLDKKIDNIAFLEGCNLPRSIKKNRVSAEKLLLIALDREQYLAAFMLGVFYEHGLFKCDGDKMEYVEKYYAIARKNHIPEMNALDSIRKHPAAFPGCATDAAEKLAISMFIYLGREDLRNSLSFFFPEQYNLKFYKFTYSLVICHYASLDNYPLSRTLVSNILANYENENGFIKQELFYDFFEFSSQLKDKANIREMLATVCNMHDHGNKQATLSLINFGYIKPGTRPAYEVADNYDPVDDFEDEIDMSSSIDTGSSSSPSFPSYLNSSSDNTKTIHLFSCFYSEFNNSHATYQDEDGIYIDIILDNGNYYDSSTRERYY